MPVARTYRCYAKLNLTLEVLGRRPDGYHDLASIIHTISLADLLRVDLAPASTLTCAVEGLDLELESNLVLRAARLLQARLEPTAGAALALSKRIPAAAGLGGGSTDAAATLAILARLWTPPARQPRPSSSHLPADDLASKPRAAKDEARLVATLRTAVPGQHAELPDQSRAVAESGPAADARKRRIAGTELAALAAAVGSDVPFFLRGGAAVMGGRGEQLTPLPPMRDQWLVLLVPAHALEDKTRRLYAALEPSDFTTGELTARTAARLRAGEPLREADLGNAFARAARAVFPGLATRWAEAEARSGWRFHLSGAGPALFALAPDRAAAREVAARLARDGDVTAAVRTVARARVAGGPTMRYP